MKSLAILASKHEILRRFVAVVVSSAFRRSLIKQTYAQLKSGSEYAFDQNGPFDLPAVPRPLLNLDLPSKQKIGVKKDGFVKAKSERNADNSGREFWV